MLLRIPCAQELKKTDLNSYRRAQLLAAPKEGARDLFPF
jgi:hypothetical protein